MRFRHQGKQVNEGYFQGLKEAQRLIARVLKESDEQNGWDDFIHSEKLGSSVEGKVKEQRDSVTDSIDEAVNSIVDNIVDEIVSENEGELGEVGDYQDSLHDEVHDAVESAVGKWLGTLYNPGGNR